MERVDLDILDCLLDSKYFWFDRNQINDRISHHCWNFSRQKISARLGYLESLGLVESKPVSYRASEKSGILSYNSTCLSRGKTRKAYTITQTGKDFLGKA